jgi:hypothetical protein
MIAAALGLMGVGPAWAESGGGENQAQQVTSAAVGATPVVPALPAAPSCAPDIRLPTGGIEIIGAVPDPKEAGKYRAGACTLIVVSPWVMAGNPQRHNQITKVYVGTRVEFFGDRTSLSTTWVFAGWNTKGEFVFIEVPWPITLLSEGSNAFPQRLKELREKMEGAGLYFDMRTQLPGYISLYPGFDLGRPPSLLYEDAVRRSHPNMSYSDIIARGKRSKLLPPDYPVPPESPKSAPALNTTSP